MTAKDLIGPLFGAATVLSWASFNLAAKHGIEAGLPPETLAFLRFAVPGIVALPLIAMMHLRGRQVQIPIAQLVILVLLGGPLFGWVAVSGYVFAPLSHGLLFAPVAVFVSGTLLAWVLLGERLTLHQCAAAALMFTGLGTLVGFDARTLSGPWPIGAFLFLVAGGLWGAYTVLLRYWRVPVGVGTLAISAGSAVLAVPTLGLAALEGVRAIPASAVLLQVVMQGLVGGVVSLVAMMAAVRMLSVKTAALLPAFTPVVAVGLAWTVFGTLPSSAEIFGIALIAAGFCAGAGAWPRNCWPGWQTKASG